MCLRLTNRSSRTTVSSMVLSWILRVSRIFTIRILFQFSRNMTSGRKWSFIASLTVRFKITWIKKPRTNRSLVELPEAMAWATTRKLWVDQLSSPKKKWRRPRFTLTVRLIISLEKDKLKQRPSKRPWYVSKHSWLTISSEEKRLKITIIWQILSEWKFIFSNYESARLLLQISPHNCFCILAGLLRRIYVLRFREKNLLFRLFWRMRSLDTHQMETDCVTSA